jgi:hypothetical protein
MDRGVTRAHPDTLMKTKSCNSRTTVPRYFRYCRTPLTIDSGGNSIQGSVRSCPLQEVARLPTDCDRMLPREKFFLPESKVRRPTRPLTELTEALSKVEVSDLYFKVQKMYIRFTSGATPRLVLGLVESNYAVLTPYDFAYEEFYGWEVNPPLNPLVLEPEFLKQRLRCLSDMRRKGGVRTWQDSSMIVRISETCPDGPGMNDCSVIPVSDDAVVVPTATSQIPP